MWERLAKFWCLEGGRRAGERREGGVGGRWLEEVDGCLRGKSRGDISTGPPDAQVTPGSDSAAEPHCSARSLTPSLPAFLSLTRPRLLSARALSRRSAVARNNVNDTRDDLGPEPQTLRHVKSQPAHGALSPEVSSSRILEEVCGATTAKLYASCRNSEDPFARSHESGEDIVGHHQGMPTNFFDIIHSPGPPHFYHRKHRPEARLSTSGFHGSYWPT